MYINETPATKAADFAALQGVPRDICTLGILKTFLTQAVLAHTGMYCQLLPKNREGIWDPINFYLQGSVQSI